MPRTINIFKEADSHYKFVGLKPLTAHYFYFNKKLQTARVKQLGKKLGQALISDANGTLEVIYYLDSGISSNSPANFAYKVPNLAAGISEVVVTTYNSANNDLPENYLNSSVSSSKIIFGALRK